MNVSCHPTLIWSARIEIESEVCSWQMNPCRLRFEQLHQRGQLRLCSLDRDWIGRNLVVRRKAMRHWEVHSDEGLFKAA